MAEEETIDTSATGIADTQLALAKEYLDFSKDQFEVGEDRLQELETFTGMAIQTMLAQGTLNLEKQKELDKFIDQSSDNIKAIGQKAIADNAAFQKQNAADAAAARALGGAALARYEASKVATEANAANIVASADDAMSRYLAGRAKTEESASRLETVGAQALAQAQASVAETDEAAGKLLASSEVGLQRYNDKFVPIEEQIADFASGYDTPERRAEAAARAKADVAEATEAQRNQNERRQTAAGIRPDSGRFAAIDRATSTAGTIAGIDAQNRARETIEDRGVAIRGDAAQLGGSIADRAAAQSALGIQSRHAGQQLLNQTTGVALDADKSATGLRHSDIQMGNQTAGLVGDANRSAADIYQTNQSLGDQASRTAIAANQSAADVNATGLKLSQAANDQAISAESTASGLQSNNMQLGNQTTGLYLDAVSNATGLKQANENLHQNLATNAQNGILGTSSILSSAGNTKLNAENLDYKKTADDNASAREDSNAFGNFLGTAAGWLLSDENVKEDKQEIPEGEALDAIDNMRVEAWKYKDGVADEGGHIGTYAQDFNDATGVGNDQAIPIQDAIGVTMKAIQDLNQKVDALATGIGKKKKTRISSTTNDANMQKVAAQQQQPSGIRAA